MRTPEHRSAYPRPGKKLEEDLDMRYLAPGAFTVLPETGVPPQPPGVPPPHRLPTTTRRHKHQSFAIIGESSSGDPTSRSTSPTGRVSPFKGRGFNPLGSRHASPLGSPIPPEDPRSSPRILSPKSRIPKPSSRRGSSGQVFGEKVVHYDPNLGSNTQLSKSLTNLKQNRKPPPSPRRVKRPVAFQQLSPIAGSSPEPSQSLSSPSRIPTKSRSTPPSRIASPTRDGLTRSQSKPKLSARDPSPNNTRIPVRRYDHVRSKIDSYHNKAKPKIPPKPQQESTDQSEESDVPKNKVLSRRNSVNKLNRNNSRPNLLSKTANYSNRNANITSDSEVESSRKVPAKTASLNTKTTHTGSSSKIADPISKNLITDTSPATNADTKGGSKQDLTRVGAQDSVPSTNEVVSSTTSTVTKPLHIETAAVERSRVMSPLIDGRVLNATSVTQAINKMNDTVLNTQTLIKEHGLCPRMTPSAVSATAEEDQSHQALKSKTADHHDKTDDVKDNKQTAVEKVDDRMEASKHVEDKTTNLSSLVDTGTKFATSAITNVTRSLTNNNNNNHVTSNHANNHMAQVGLGNPKVLDESDQGATKMSVNDRIREARTVIAADVRPIKITVREKPSSVEVQSGNLGPHVSISNGLNERPGLPPAQHQTPPDEPVSKDEPPPNACKRFLGACTEKLSCRKLATRTPRVEEDAAGCFACLKKKTAEPDQVRINVEQEDEEGEKKKLWDRLKCCKKNRVADMQSCLPIGKRKGSWLERSESLAETAEAESAKCCSKTMCKKFFRALFCVNVCLGCAALCGRKKTEELPISRKASMISSKKKSLTPTTLPPPEDTTPKIDASLVEHTSHMKAAIPILPVWLAWFCCVMNCIAPGTGTILSGFFCLCIGKPRFSQKDGPKPRIGAFLIDLIIGFSQCFTVLFCLVGWGWSIWWGVIMVKIARRHKKLKQMENLEENASRPTPNPNLTRDADRRV